MASRDELAAELQTKWFAQRLAKLGERLGDPAFWREVAPDLPITDHPLASLEPSVTIATGDPDRYRRDLHEAGYLATSVVFEDGDLAALRQGIERVVEAGLPSVFACVFDAFYRLFARLEPLLSSILGPGYWMVPEGFWAFHVAPGDAGVGHWSATGPHRDSLGPDPAVLAGSPPSLVNVWIALTDAAPPSSCMYLVPAPFDPAYRTRERDVRADGFRLQDVRAVPTPAGSLLAWTTHLAHWGSRHDAPDGGSRMSAAMYFQSAAVPAFDASAMDPTGPISLERRLYWIARTIRRPDVFDFPAPVV